MKKKLVLRYTVITCILLFVMAVVYNVSHGEGSVEGIPLDEEIGVYEGSPADIPIDEETEVYEEITTEMPIDKETKVYLNTTYYPSTFDELIEYFIDKLQMSSTCECIDLELLSEQCIYDIIKDFLSEPGRTRDEYLEDFDYLIELLDSGYLFGEVLEYLRDVDVMAFGQEVRSFLANVYHINDMIFHAVVLSDFFEPLEISNYLVLWTSMQHEFIAEILMDNIDYEIPYKVLPNTGFVLLDIEIIYLARAFLS